MTKHIIPAILLLATLATPTLASTFGVSPIRLDLAGAIRTSSVVVTNTSDKELPLKVDTVSWTMDEAGTELYTPSTNLIFFPKELVVPPGESRTIRVGVQSAAAPVAEETYRLFIRQQPVKADAATQAQVAVVVNFGVPIFVKQPGAKPSLEVTVSAAPVVRPKTVTLQLKNGGTAHARLEKVSFKGTEDALGIGSPYILRGLTRMMTLAVTPTDCARGTKQTIVLEHSESTQEVEVDLARACE